MKRLVFLIIALLVLTGCSNIDETPHDKLQITTTSTMITDLVKTIGKEHVEVHGMMVSGVDPHLYKAKPSDVRSIDNADIVVFNGVHLEAKLDDVLTALPELNKKIIKIEDGLEPTDIIHDPDEGGYDPHVWFDIDLWIKAADYTATKLSEFDPDNARDYQNNARNYIVQLEELKEYAQMRVNEIPAKQRVLVTAHDAFAYLGRSLGIQVEAIQGISTQSEAGIADINNVSKLIVDRNIKAIYTESSMPAKTIESLQASVRDRGYNVEIGGELYSDSLKDDASYLDTFKLNIDTIVDNLK